MSRLPKLIVLVAVLAAVLGFLLSRQQSATTPPPTPTSLVLFGKANPLPEFSLERAQGGAFTKQDLQGKLTLMFFGFTHCPDVCPTTLATMREIETRLQDDPALDRIQMVFVSIDPDRDTANVLAEYTKFFSERVVPLRGSDEALAGLTKSLGVVYFREKKPNGDIQVDHSTKISLIDPEARMVGEIKPPHDGARIANDLKALVSP
ncbi:hypothetical protein C7S18_14885 [Ahniella affigens]|uniref:Thioredoxin domain-containing protein n=1 Tax=Ahniella affigens TaxID=2021234 RepID=A0A2P1PU75_9GAMM|nr:SCO family protein [Ahniella affigens]AVP98393.1 hypothetical protein C7S18_14885 [Ahniella affigens]